MQSSTATQSQPLPSPEFYTWKGFRCAYEHYSDSDSNLALLLIHPVGVGLSRGFWHPFCQAWDEPYPIYNPDLLGCGDSDMPHLVYRPEDWANQLDYFLKNIIQKPVVIVVQGALLPVALELAQKQPDLVKGLIFAGPPPWELMTTPTSSTKQKLLWNLFFDTPIGNLFYRYARRRQFLESFSTRQLFEKSEDVDSEWLEMLKAGSEDTANRYAVFSFLAGFWRKDYESEFTALDQPTLVLFGEKASSISKTGEGETPEERMIEYTKHLPNGEAKQISGRNVLPYESTEEFIDAITPFISQL